MPVLEIGSPAELRKLIASGKPLVVKFEADWCGDCKALRPHFELHTGRLEKSGVTVARISLSHERTREGERKKAVYPTAEHSALKTEYAREGFPTVVFFKDGRVVASGLEDTGKSYERLVGYFLSRVSKA